MLEELRLFKIKTTRWVQHYLKLLMMTIGIMYVFLNPVLQQRVLCTWMVIKKVLGHRITKLHKVVVLLLASVKHLSMDLLLLLRKTMPLLDALLGLMCITTHLMKVHVVTVLLRAQKQLPMLSTRNF